MPQPVQGSSSTNSGHLGSPADQSSGKSAVEKKISTRSIRSPLPLPLHNNLTRQRSGNNVGHHRQYVLLRDKKGDNVPQSPISSAQLHPVQSSTNISNKNKPFLRKQQSAKYFFSVDDDEDEIEEDLAKEYLEGYNDALKNKFKATLKDEASCAVGTSDKKKLLEFDVINNLQQASKDINELKELEGDSIHTANNTIEEMIQEADLIDETLDSSEPQISQHDADHNDLIEDGSSVLSNDSFTLKERQVAINETHPFGIRIWKPAIYKKDRSVQKEAELDVHAIPGSSPSVGYSVKFFNAIWTCTFGLLLFVVCYTLGFITYLFSMFSNPRTNDSILYAKFYWNLAWYLLKPFGKIMILKSDINYINEDANVGSSVDEFARWRTENQGKLFFSSNFQQNKQTSFNADTMEHQQTQAGHSKAVDPEAGVNNQSNTINRACSSESDFEEQVFYKRRLFGRGEWNIGRIVFYLQYYFVLFPITAIISMITWLSVLCIPISKVLYIVNSHIGRHPLALAFEDDKYYERIMADPQIAQNESILILTYRSFGIHYYKYTVDGTNIFFINLIFLVLFTILDFYLLKEGLDYDNIITNSNIIFVLCLISIVPLAYFIGQAVASISAQTSMGLGAVINAFFSTIVEVYLYCIALDQSKAKLVEGSLIGSILGAVLLLPGGSMCFGAIRRKTQRYNPASAGVSSTMLLYAIIVMLSPTILYQIYGEYRVVCSACDTSFGEDCRNCHYYQPSVVIDPLYIRYLRPFTVICAISLFMVYCICLLFTLKTHAALIWSSPINVEKKVEAPITVNLPSELNSVTSLNLNDQGSHKGKQISKPQPVPVEPSGGHDAPNWSRTKSTTILLAATLLYAVIAEILVNCVDEVLKSIAIDPKFLGLTIFALVPNTTEFVNAFSFAMHGNVALSMEIGSAYALQVCLLQIPIVMLYSVYNFTKDYSSGVLTLSTREGWNGIPRLTKLIGLLASPTRYIVDTLAPTSDLKETVANTFGVIQETASDATHIGVDKIFSLIFPHWDFIASLLGVYMFTYIYTEGKSNYFKGSILIFLYIILISGFYLAIDIDNQGVTSYSPIQTISGKV
ncbi:hypothetical protein CANINC_000607 [Pichia inconspicua]|uniref:Sodium/calcium exchanger membrane region domain-containing protein n=1 Tax=Pichia inconspicua TaxID=52247 RepID=A0A4T0X5E8_9ASCO|nr:hypothetical protein CANINC_000607 [[Candida] inconspicua]